MKRALYAMAVLALACGVSWQAHAEGRGGRDHELTGTFEKNQDGKLTFKSNGETHIVAAGEHAKDDAKKKIANADKELVGQGSFNVLAFVKHEGESSVLMIDAIYKNMHGDHRDSGDNVAGGPGGDKKDGGGGAGGGGGNGAGGNGSDHHDGVGGPDDHK